MFSYAVNVNSLRKVIIKKNSKNTETWIEYFKKIKNFKVEDYGKPKDTLGIRLTIDFIEDFNTVSKVLKN